MARADEGLTRCAQLGERWWLPELLNRAARMAQQTEDTERAAALAAEACTLADELGNERLSIESRITLAFVAHGTAHAGAAPLFATLVPRAEAFGDRGILTRLYPAAGLEALVAGRVADATRWFRIGLELARDTGYRQSVGFGVMGAQAIASIGAQWRTAARLHGALAPYRSTLRHRMPPKAWQSFEELTTGAREAIGDDEYEATVCAAETLTWDEALQEAIGACEVASGSGEPQARATSHRAWSTDLTERELDVVRLIAAGGTNKDVAAALGISAKTVMHHSVAIYRKLGVRGRAEATAHAYRNNLIDAAQPL
jgi:DNA-binding CsgD family transcriptional regulator